MHYRKLNKIITRIARRKQKTNRHKHDLREKNAAFTVGSSDDEPQFRPHRNLIDYAQHSAQDVQCRESALR